MDETVGQQGIHKILSNPGCFIYGPSGTCYMVILILCIMLLYLFFYSNKFVYLLFTSVLNKNSRVAGARVTGLVTRLRLIVVQKWESASFEISGCRRLMNLGTRYQVGVLKRVQTVSSVKFV